MVSERREMSSVWLVRDGGRLVRDEGLSVRDEGWLVNG